MQELGIPFWALLIIAFALVMLFTDIGKAYTFSEMRLEITCQGVPAVGAVVKRRIRWQKELTDEFTADSSGVVVLPQVRERSIMQFTPSEFVASQVLVVQFSNQEFKIWINAKRRPQNNSELDGNPMTMKCELSDEQRLVTDFRNSFLTNCTWK
ncbi:DUF6795 domain-containing protein [Microbulbifer pacificus]|uniref:DUF6795 domain-containing protein n=1 Tax=Microbulbifer pacificus TaxID=407164 RepID=A0AAU0MU65_9GAMM|nr:DUF6795 domain-containing protein [Microbulbifer pacificus]WOX04012.1 DUF6795 domain-containing protein [Microbulbifer pacificus]